MAIDPQDLRLMQLQGLLPPGLSSAASDQTPVEALSDMGVGGPADVSMLSPETLALLKGEPPAQPPVQPPAQPPVQPPAAPSVGPAQPSGSPPSLSDTGTAQPYDNPTPPVGASQTLPEPPAPQQAVPGNVPASQTPQWKSIANPPVIGPRQAAGPDGLPVQPPPKSWSQLFSDHAERSLADAFDLKTPAPGASAESTMQTAQAISNSGAKEKLDAIGMQGALDIEKAKREIPVYEDRQAAIDAITKNTIDKLQYFSDATAQHYKNREQLAQQAAAVVIPDTNKLWGGKGSFQRAQTIGLTLSHAGGVTPANIAAMMQGAIQPQLNQRDAILANAKEEGELAEEAGRLVTPTNEAAKSMSDAAQLQLADRIELIAKQMAPGEAQQKMVATAAELKMGLRKDWADDAKDKATIDTERAHQAEAYASVAKSGAETKNLAKQNPMGVQLPDGRVVNLTVGRPEDASDANKEIANARAGIGAIDDATVAAKSFKVSAAEKMMARFGVTSKDQAVLDAKLKPVKLLVSQILASGRAVGPAIKNWADDGYDPTKFSEQIIPELNAYREVAVNDVVSKYGPRTGGQINKDTFGKAPTDAPAPTIDQLRDSVLDVSRGKENLSNLPTKRADLDAYVDHMEDTDAQGKPLVRDPDTGEAPTTQYKVNQLKDLRSRAKVIQMRAISDGDLRKAADYEQLGKMVEGKISDLLYRDKTSDGENHLESDLVQARAQANSEATQ